MDFRPWKLSSTKAGRTPSGMDLSATPFFLRGSGYAEGTLFPWTVSDFSLMDAIECGIVKLPRVPVADNIPGEQVPGLPQPCGSISGRICPELAGTGPGTWTLSICPPPLLTALEALYGHYKTTYEHWQEGGGYGATLLHSGLQQHFNFQAGL